MKTYKKLTKSEYLKAKTMWEFDQQLVNSLMYILNEKEIAEVFKKVMSKDKIDNLIKYLKI